MNFADLRLAEPLLRAIVAEGYSVPTPIQAQAIPHVLAGKDVLGSAQTGTGKTAAFALPILHRLAEHPPATGQGRRIRTLVLSPTRELALQIMESFRTYGKNMLALRYTVIFGGVNQGRQVDALKHGVDVVIATPGRLLDLMNQGHVDLRGVQMFVLDEADRMLDMGFINDIRKIVAKLPQQRQTLMFSATMPKEIRELADTLLKNPVTVTVAQVASTAEQIEQYVYHVEKGNKPALLAHLINNMPISRALVFTRTKRGADKVVKQLHQSNIKAEAIHSNKSQNARQRAMDNFKRLKTPILVATDIAARGIDIDDIPHVINYDLTHEPETYVHRIGRTGRAGATGEAITFCSPDERDQLKAVERMIRKSITVRGDQPVYPRSQPGDSDSNGSHRSHGHRSHAPSRQSHSSSRSASSHREPQHRSHAPRPAAAHPASHSKPHASHPTSHAAHPKPHAAGPKSPAPHSKPHTPHSKPHAPHSAGHAASTAPRSQSHSSHGSHSASQRANRPGQGPRKAPNQSRPSGHRGSRPKS